jgi:hypothetical protein
MNCDRGFLHSFGVYRACLLRSRGELAIGAHLRATDLYAVGPFGSLTMMQSSASAAKLRAAGPFSQSASVPCSNTASRHLGSSIRQSAEKPGERRVGKGMLFRAFSLPDAG